MKMMVMRIEDTRCGYARERWTDLIECSKFECKCCFSFFGASYVNMERDDHKLVVV